MLVVAKHSRYIINNIPHPAVNFDGGATFF